MPPLIPRDIYIQSMSTHSFSSSQNDASQKNISVTETEYSDCVRLSWVKIMLAVFGLCGDAITVYHSARHLCVLQCCSAAGWSDNHGVKMEHLANFIRPRSPLGTMNPPRGWGSHSTSSSSSWDIDESILSSPFSLYVTGIGPVPENLFRLRNCAENRNFTGIMNGASVCAQSALATLLRPENFKIQHHFFVFFW